MATLVKGRDCPWCGHFGEGVVILCDHFGKRARYSPWCGHFVVGVATLVRAW